MKENESGGGMDTREIDCALEVDAGDWDHTITLITIVGLTVIAGVWNTFCPFLQVLVEHSNVSG
jgi:hypothetical protein